MRPLAPSPHALFLALLPLCAACGSPTSAFLPESAPASVAGLYERGYDVRFYDIDIRLDLDERAVDGKVLVDYTAVWETDLIVLDAVSMEITAVRGPGGELEWDYDGRELAVRLPNHASPGDDGWIEVSYRSVPPTGFYFVMPEDSGFEHMPHVFTQGECEDNRYWLPCNDRPYDRAGHALRAVVPANWTTVAAGELMLDERNGSTRTVEWRLEREMPTYLITFAAGPFQRLDAHWENVPIHHFVEAGDVAAAEASLRETPEILDFLSDHTGYPYPFAKYAHTAVRNFPYGGMENVTATTITRNALRLPHHLEESPAWGLVAHEAAHQWFGDVVTCESWPHAWLNEGFATYYTLLYGRSRFGEGHFLYEMGKTIDSYTAACRGERARALVKHHYERPMELFFDGTIYPGGASRLQLLRGWFGERSYREAIELYLARHQFQPVDSDDLRLAFEEVTGRDLSVLFDQWVYGTGYPELEITWGSGGGTLNVAVTQTQSTQPFESDGHMVEARPFAFEFPLDLRWIDGDGMWRDKQVWVANRQESFSLPAEGEVKFVEIDPHAYLPATFEVKEPVAASEARARKAKSARQRYLALQILKDAPAPSVSPLVFWQVAELDRVWQLRRDAAEILAVRVNVGDIDRLFTNYRREKSVPVRNAWLGALLRFAGHPEVEDLVNEVLEDETASAAARVQAIRARARRLDGDPLRAFLTPWMERESPNDQYRDTAFEILEELLPDEQTRNTLMAYARVGNPMPARQSAMRHLEGWVEKDQDVFNLMVEALSSHNTPLRRTVAEIAGRHRRLFRDVIEERLPSETDARARRALAGEA